MFGICCVRGVTQPAGTGNATETDSTRNAENAETGNAETEAKPETPEEADLRANCQLADSDKSLVSCTVSAQRNCLRFLRNETSY